MAPRLSSVEGDEPSHPPIGVIERNQNPPTTIEGTTKGNADQESYGGGASGTSPTDTDGAPFRTTTNQNCRFDLLLVHWPGTACVAFGASLPLMKLYAANCTLLGIIHS